jgi:hypothetical protein
VIEEQIDNENPIATNCCLLTDGSFQMYASAQSTK